MGVMALITYGLGVQTVLGAFVAGILVGESPILTEHIQNSCEDWWRLSSCRCFSDRPASAPISPYSVSPQLLAVTGLIVAIASIGKFTGAFAGGKSSGMSVRESLALGCGMNARGSTEVIVATIGLSMGATDAEPFHDDRDHGC